MAYGKTMKGFFTPLYPQKYIGDPKKIIYRSSWELKFMSTLDKNPKVKHWASEELAIPYISPYDKRRHRYFPDFFVEMTDGRKVVIEVKPKAQTMAPPKRKVTRKYVEEVVTFGVNQAKWQAATELCERKGWEFRVITEDDLFG